MAVRADERAFLGLRAQCRERPREAAPADLEQLRRRIEVVKLQCTGMGVEAAEHAPAAALGDKQRLDPPPALLHCIDVAGSAAHAAVADAVEARPPVDPALPHDRCALAAVAARRSEPSAQSVPAEP